MFRIIKWAAGPAVAFALMAGTDAPQAQADDGVSIRLGNFGLRVGGGHHGHYSGHGYRSYYGGGHYGHYPHYSGHHYGHGYRHHRGGYFHDTTHYDYHPPQFIPHRGHYDYVPGHYHLHRSGHWHH